MSASPSLVHFTSTLFVPIQDSTPSSVDHVDPSRLVTLSTSEPLVEDLPSSLDATTWNVSAPLPWTAALASFRQENLDTQARARRTLEQTVMLSLGSFPHAIIPNPLLRELSALSERSGLKLPLVEEVAADIFMGTFTSKWSAAARATSEHLAESLYAHYYDLPPASAYGEPEARPLSRWGKKTADGFAALCRRRGAESGSGRSGLVAASGVVLEQAQILTTHNLAVLVEGLGLAEQIESVAPALARRTFRWIVRRQAQPAASFHAALIMLKNTAYAWRQAIFFLSHCEESARQREVGELAELVSEQEDALRARLAPAVTGLRHVLEGGRFDEFGRSRGARRFLGWSTGTHWLMPPVRGAEGPS